MKLKDLNKNMVYDYKFKKPFPLSSVTAMSLGYGNVFVLTCHTKYVIKSRRSVVRSGIFIDYCVETNCVTVLHEWPYFVYIRPLSF